MQKQVEYLYAMCGEIEGKLTYIWAKKTTYNE